MKNYNLSEIAKEYATKNQCGLPLTPEQLLNSVVVYVNEEVTDLAINSFPFTTNEKESVFNATSVSYSDNTVTTEYTSDINGKKFTMKQPFGARENGGLTCDVNESGTAMEVGIDMTGAEEGYVLTSVNNTPTWEKYQKTNVYRHLVYVEGTSGNTVYEFYFTFEDSKEEKVTSLNLFDKISGLGANYQTLNRYPVSGSANTGEQITNSILLAVRTNSSLSTLSFSVMLANGTITTRDMTHLSTVIDTVTQL